jgi:succinoglycan biosynthesis transport protein ExoP
MDFNFLQVLSIFRARYRVALYALVTTLVVGLAVFLLLPKQYAATSSLVFDVKSPDPVAGTVLPVTSFYTATQVDVINSSRVAQRVVAELRMADSPTVKQQWQDATGGKGKIEVWLGDVLRKFLRVAASKENNIITITYISEDPVFAAAVANAFAQAYTEANIELRTDPARQLARWFDDQSKQARANLEKTQTRLSDFLQKNGIVTKDEHLDAETARLNDLTTQLTGVQGQTFDFESKKRSGDNTLPDVMQSSVVAGLRTDIARQESKLEEAARNLGKNHPQYQRMEAELAALKKQHELEMKRVTTGFASSTSVGRGREADLKAAIAVQKKKLLELKTLRDQLAVLQRDVDGAQSAYDSVARRYNTSTLESQLTQTNVSVLSSAELPTEPYFPVLSKFSGTTVLIGIALGCGLIFLLELIDRRIRSVDDLTQMLELPVLAVIERPRLKPQDRLVSWWRTKRLALR